MSRIIALSTPQVKATRNTARKPAPFGDGILHRPVRFEQPSDADAQWWTENSPANATGYEVVGLSDSETDFTAGCSMATARMSSGFGLF